MEPSARPYNPSSHRAPRGRGSGATSRRDPVAADTAPTVASGANAATKAGASAATKPRARRSAKPRATTTSAVGEQPPAAPDTLERDAGARVTTDGVAAETTAERTDETSDELTDDTADATEVSASADVEETASVSGSGPLIGVDDFEDIFTRFQTPIINFIYRLVGNREQAFDLAQDVFVKAYRALAGGATIQGGALSSWLYRIASNTATDALRRRRLISWLPLSLFNDDRGVGAGMPGADNGFGQQGLSEEHLASAMGAFTSGYDGGRFEQRVADREIVERVLKRLPQKYAACLVLYEHEGFSCAEIADVLHVTPSAVKMRLMRARERFISMYQQEMEGRR
ncbi:MAG TPA: RNA polymerase sigma factor [Ktedonobacterales bacterium]|nr:RNA polymerase sigma factor [Ktedonobacterales bacterium]